MLKTLSHSLAFNWSSVKQVQKGNVKNVVQKQGIKGILWIFATGKQIPTAKVQKSGRESVSQAKYTVEILECCGCKGSKENLAKSAAKQDGIQYALSWVIADA